jgi:nicotinamide-nucleotide amidase
MSEINKVQAMLPVGCDVLANSCGTAPGIAARLGECEVYVTPGVPSEMRTMYDRQILPRLPGGGGVILQRMVRLFGTGESNVAEILADLLHRSGPVIVGTTVSSGLISVRITSRAKTVEQADRQARQIIDGVIDRMGEMVLGVGEVATMQSAVERLLMEYGQTIALAESCTGGKIAEMITDLPGASEYFRGGVVAYDNDIKIGQLAVPGELIERDGAVSQTVAAAMATNVRERFGSDWGIGVTGIAGPGGGTAEKPVGLVYTSLAGPDGVEVERHLMPGDRTRVRERSALAALNALRLKLLRTR